MSDHQDGSTRGADYTERLRGLQGARWKQLVPVQLPYRWNLRRLRLGRTLDVGCGVGRNLENLRGPAVGVDHNDRSVAICRARGFVAYTSDEFAGAPDARPESFDAVLFAHVLEHMEHPAAVELVCDYLPYLRHGGRIVLVTPQERGHASDPTHVEFMDLAALRAVADGSGCAVDRAFSFPFPRRAGRLFTYNEFVLVATRP